MRHSSTVYVCVSKSFLRSLLRILYMFLERIIKKTKAMKTGVKREMYSLDKQNSVQHYLNEYRVLYDTYQNSFINQMFFVETKVIDFIGFRQPDLRI